MSKKTNVVKSKKATRTKKSGWVYLLESLDARQFPDGSLVKTYKYGATTKHYTERCRKINSAQKIKFSPIAAFKSNDIFKDENIVAYGLLDGGFAKISEYVCCNLLSDSIEVKDKFLSFATPYKERGKEASIVAWEA